MTALPDNLSAAERPISPSPVEGEGREGGRADLGGGHGAGPARRSPTELRPARLAPLPKLPIFLDLAGKRALLVGGSEGAAWKAELLAAAGAQVDILAEEPSAELVALCAGERAALRLIRRGWSPADLDAAAIAVADMEDDSEAERFTAAARERGVPVNVVDRPAFCDFQFGAIVNRAPVVIAISTDGAAPVLGQAIRRRIEALLPAALGAWGAAAQSFRGRLAELMPGKADRRRFWDAFAERVFASGRSDPHEEVARLAEDTLAAGPSPGEVILVGAGPGDPELLTLKAVRLLHAADVIVHDRLVTPEVLELARREARRIEVGKKGHGAACKQDEINALLVDLAGQGLRVVRLKGGDPTIFGRAGEEIAACRTAGIPVRVVPGVTTATAAAAALNGSLTHRDHAQRVQFVTGHDRRGRLPTDLDDAVLAHPGGTTCVYMPRHTIAELARRLTERGLAPDTRVALVSNVSRSDERSEQTTLGELVGRDLGSDDDPVIALIGEVVAGQAQAPAALAAARAAVPA